MYFIDNDHGVIEKLLCRVTRHCLELLRGNTVIGNETDTTRRILDRIPLDHGENLLTDLNTVLLRERVKV